MWRTMRRVTITVPMYVPEWLYRPLRVLKHKLILHRADSPIDINLLGDRDIEWSWIASQMPLGPGERLLI